MRGFEVSKCQQNVIWPKAMTGNDFVIVGSSDGENKFDQMFCSHCAGAKAVGLSVGVYHQFGHHGSSDKHDKELAGLLAMIAGKEIDLPVYLSYQDGDHLTGKIALTQCVLSDFDALRAAGFRVGLYVAGDWIDKRINALLLPEDASIILCADATNERRVDALRYSTTGAVPGIAGQVSLIRTVLDNFMPQGSTPTLTQTTIAPREQRHPRQRKQRINKESEGNAWV